MRYVFKQGGGVVQPQQNLQTTPVVEQQQEVLPPSKQLNCQQELYISNEKIVVDSHLSHAYIKKFAPHCRYFVETGTYRGDTVWVALTSNNFKSIKSIELNEQLYNEAAEKFKTYSIVEILKGDSVDIMEEVVKEFQGPVCFYLDAHASGPLGGGRTGSSPLLAELEIISKMKSNRHTIFIDDVRLMGSAEWDYVSKDDVVEAVKKINPQYRLKYVDGYQEKDLLVCHVAY